MHWSSDVSVIESNSKFWNTRLQSTSISQNFLGLANHLLNNSNCATQLFFFFLDVKIQVLEKNVYVSVIGIGKYLEKKV